MRLIFAVILTGAIASAADAQDRLTPEQSTDFCRVP